MKKFLVLLTLFALSFGTVSAQSILERAARHTVNRTRSTVTNKINQKIDKKIDDAVDEAFDGKQKEKEQDKRNKSSKAKRGKDAEDNYDEDYDEAYDIDNESAQGSQAATPQEKKKAVETAYAKSDFVAGDEIFFEDDIEREQLGEFPSQWDLLDGTAEVANFGGKKCIYFDPDGGAEVAPLMEDMKHYLPEVFTLEFDFWVNDPEQSWEDYIDSYRVWFYNEEKREKAFEIYIDNTRGDECTKDITWYYNTPALDGRSGRGVAQGFTEEGWHHFALSFNKRALKVYIDGVRIGNVPNALAPTYFTVNSNMWGSSNPFREAVTNFRLAKGAVPLYDRMMNEGKFITYGITFDVNKAIIKPESLGEINRIVQLLNENPSLNFSVEGHTDATGGAEHNLQLSEQRAQAIVDKLVELGIDRARLTAVGKGQTNPIAPNDTDEGRAKNRRVEFVKK